MEDVLEIYSLSYDSEYPVVCMDESSKQLIGEVKKSIPAAPGHPNLIDDEYIRNGVVSVFIEVEPKGGRRHIEISVNKRQVIAGRAKVKVRLRE